MVVKLGYRGGAYSGFAEQKDPAIRTVAGEVRRALELMREGRVGTTVFGAHDASPRRLWAMAKLWMHYYLDFRRWFGHHELDD